MATRPVLVVDFGAQYAQLLARRVREAGVYSEIVPHDADVSEILSRRPAAIILSGGPASVYAEGAPRLERGLFDAGVPMLGVCYGFQLMAEALGGVVKHTNQAEFGRTEVVRGGPSLLFEGLPERLSAWMSHRDAVVVAPEGLLVTASSKGAEVAAFEDHERRLFGLQWHPEVAHSEGGQDVVEAFLYRGAGIEPTWTPAGIVESTVEALGYEVGDRQVLCGLSGGVDSAVAAALVQRAVGDRLTCVFVDHGLLREGEAAQIEEDFVAATGVRLRTKHAAGRFLSALAGLRDPEDKRKAVGREFIKAFEEAAREVIAENGSGRPPIELLVQGTLYPDVVESGGGAGTSVIKSHHNVGGLPEDLSFRLVEPLRALFKDEVRRIGVELGLPEAIVWRQPFPGPGLAIRIVGEVTEKRLAVLRRADAIVREETARAGLDRSIWQFPVVLLAEVGSVGVQGDSRTYGWPVVLRPVTSEDAMTADWARLPHEVLALVSNRITNEVEEVNRVVLDVTSKPPASIEWE
ncbi:MAG: glutamine-hydrolyzing GMP synthase [Acidimicrobiales bacterium]